MMRIEGSNPGLEVVEENNTVEVSVRSVIRATDLRIQVPRRSSLKLRCIHDGDVRVEDVEGDLEVTAASGSVSLMGISGSAVVHALNDDITVSFDAVAPDKAMAFSSMNGDIDITFPDGIGANLVFRSGYGEIFSDFTVDLMSGSREPTVEDTRAEGGRYRYKADKSIYGTIGGGGPEIQFKNLNGNIYLRKAGR
jgi:DUF4097 and DUF4098 domain-containing protein YvlB